MSVKLTKDEYVLFVAPTDIQMRAYGRVVASGEQVLRGDQPLGYSRSTDSEQCLRLQDRVDI